MSIEVGFQWVLCCSIAIVISLLFSHETGKGVIVILLFDVCRQELFNVDVRLLLQYACSCCLVLAALNVVAVRGPAVPSVIVAASLWTL